MQSPARQTRSATRAARLSACAPVTPPVVRTYGKRSTRYRDRVSQSGAGSPDSTPHRGRSSRSGDSSSGSTSNGDRSSRSVSPPGYSTPQCLTGDGTDVKEVSGVTSGSALATSNQSFHDSQTKKVSASIFIF